MAQARRAATVLLAGCFLASATDEKFELCGCSWSSEEACGISSSQMLAGLAKTSIDDMCEKTQNAGDASKSSADVMGHDYEKRRAEFITGRECEARAEIKRVLPSRYHCSKYDAKTCFHSRQCEWGAQKEHHCGVDEERLILDVVGAQHQSHPLVQFLVTSDACREKGKQDCGAAPFCEWLHYGACDIREAYIYRQILFHPEMLILLQLLQGNAYCHSIHESYQDCYSPICRMEYGICRLNHTEADKLMRFEYTDLVGAVCQGYNELNVSYYGDSYYSDYYNSADADGEEEEEEEEEAEAGDTTQQYTTDTTMPTTCGAPCYQTAEGECKPPVKFPHNIREANISRGDWHIFGIMLQFDASSFLTERLCNMFDGNRTRCLESKETCPEHYKPAAPPVKEPHEVKDITDLTKGKTGGIGTDGVLGKVLQSAQTGEVHKMMMDFLRENPDRLPAFGASLKEGFEALTQRSTEEQQPPPPQVIQLPSDKDKHPQSAVPVLITVGALIVCALSAGMASGLICAGCMQPSRREVRLLGDETMTEYDGTLNAEAGRGGAVLNC